MRRRRIIFDYLSATAFFCAVAVSCVVAAAESASDDKKATDSNDELVKIHQLIRQIDEGTLQEQAEAVDQLQHFGPKAMPALPRLIKLLGVETQTVAGKSSVPLRSRAILTVEAIGPPATFSMLEVLHDENRLRRMSAINILGKFRDARAIPALVVLLADGDDEIAGSAEAVLINIGEPAVAPLTDALAGENVRVKSLARQPRWAICDLPRRLRQSRECCSIVTKRCETVQ